MLYGVKVGDNIMVVRDPSKGRPIVESAAPSVPEGYVAEYFWEDTGSQIVQTWEIKPIAGTETDAMLELAKLQAQDLDDAEGVESIYTHITVDEETGYETWQQPTGAHDAYPKDKIVKDPNDGQLYKSTFNGANVWGPPSASPDYWELYVEE